MEKINKSLKFNTGNLSNREYFAQIKGRDRRNLTAVLCALRDNGVQNISVRGSSLTNPKEYNDIDLLAVFGLSSLKLLDSIAELSDKNVHFKIQSGNLDFKIQSYAGVTGDIRSRFSYDGTDFDIFGENYLLSTYLKNKSLNI